MPTFILCESAHQLATQLETVRKAKSQLEKQEKGLVDSVKELTQPFLDDTGELKETVTFQIQNSSKVIKLIPGSNTQTDRQVVLDLAGPDVLEKATKKSHYQRITIGENKDD